MSKALAISTYLRLPPKQKKIILCLFWYKKRYGNAFPSQKKLLAYAGCSHQCLKNFQHKNLELNNFFFKIHKRFDADGRQTSNLFVFDSVFLRALEWLKICDYLRSPKSRYAKILSRIENEEKVAPPPPQKLPPVLEINLRKDEDKSTPQTPLKKEYIHPKILQIKIPKNDQIMLSKYPEAWIMWGLENTLYSYHNGCRIINPTAFLWANIRNAEKRILK